MPKLSTPCRKICVAQNTNRRAGKKTALQGMFAVLFCLLLAACAGIPQQTAPRTETPALSCAGDIDLSGRFSMQYAQGDKDEAMHGNFLWLQTGGHTGITLLSPLGQTIATIDVTPAAATLTESGKPPRTAADVNALAIAELGWPLPVAGLRDWLRGCAVDANGQRFVASPQTDSVVTHDGWHVRYVSWQEDAAARGRPKRIDLKRGASSTGGDVSLRLVIDSWQSP